MRSKLAIYTAIYGSKDTLKEIPERLKDKYDFICFTNDPNLKSDDWDIRYFPGVYTDTTRSHKIFKVLPHIFLPEYEMVMWVDGNIQIRDADPGDVTEEYLKNHNWAMFKHPDRDCAYEEVDVCIARKKASIPKLKRQILTYQKQGFPKNFGLHYGGLFFRRHTEPKVIEFAHHWWDEITTHSRRDQVSLQYVRWKYKFKFYEIPEQPEDNNMFEIVSHKWDFTAPVIKGTNIVDTPEL